jgi:hypothetical protein
VQLGLVNEVGDRVLMEGQHTIEVTNGYSSHIENSYVEATRVLRTVPPMPQRA